MERGFTLPPSAINRLAAQWAVGLLIGAALAYLKNGRESGSSLLWVIVAGVALLVAMGWYVKQYKYVRLSTAGIRGRPTSGFKLRQLAWNEPLTFKKASLSGLRGQLFTSSATAESVFIPQAILKSVEFKTYVAQHAPPTHVLRTTEF
jgi:hypothetical protein